MRVEDNVDFQEPVEALTVLDKFCKTDDIEVLREELVKTFRKLRELVGLLLALETLDPVPLLVRELLPLNVSDLAVFTPIVEACDVYRVVLDRTETLEEPVLATFPVVRPGLTALDLVEAAIPVFFVVLIDLEDAVVRLAPDRRLGLIDIVLRKLRDEIEDRMEVLRTLVDEARGTLEAVFRLLLDNMLSRVEIDFRTLVDELESPDRVKVGS